MHVPPSQDISISSAAAQFLSSSALMTQDFDSIIMSYSASASLSYNYSRLISLLVGRLKVSEDSLMMNRREAYELKFSYKWIIFLGWFAGVKFLKDSV